MKSEHIGKICMVRTENAGVHFGLVAEKDGKEVRLKDARRVWYWEGAATISELAVNGTKKPKSCKFPCIVESIELCDVIETIPMTEFAINSLRGVGVWEG
jgi:hypothetical protein